MLLIRHLVIDFLNRRHGILLYAPAIGSGHIALELGFGIVVYDVSLLPLPLPRPHLHPLQITMCAFISRMLCHSFEWACC